MLAVKSSRVVSIGLLRALTVRELRGRYTGSLAGALWLLLQPLALLGVYGVVFGLVFRVGLANPELTGIPYIAYIAVALWPWLAFSESVSRGMMTIQNQAAVIKKVDVPNFTFVAASVLATFLVHLAGSVVVLTALAISGVHIAIDGLPIYYAGFAVLALPALGLALMLSAFQVFVRDTEQIVQQLMTIAFYATPVLYSSTMVPHWLQFVTAMNPFGQLLDAMRIAVLGIHSAALAWVPLSVAVLAFGVLLSLGVMTFRRLAPHFEDTL